MKINLSDVAFVAWLKEWVDLWRDVESGKILYRDEKVAKKVAELLNLFRD